MTATIRNILNFLFASIAARAFGVVRSFWLARVLGPSDYGIWVAVLLIAAYAPIFAFGTVETLLKKVPFLKGKGDFEDAQQIEGGVFTFVLMISALLAASAWFVPFVLSPALLGQYVLVVRLMFLSVSLSMLSAFFYFRLQAHSMFRPASAITTVRSVLLLLLQVVLGYAIGLTGAVLGYLLCELVICLYSLVLSKNISSPIKLRFGRRLYWMLIKTGMPITLVWWTFMIQTTVDRIVSMYMLGPIATGLYGVGMSLATAYLILPDAIGQVLYPSINEKYGQTGKSEDLIPLVVDPARIMALVLPFLTCMFVVFLPLVFAYVVPKYLPGLAATQILIIGALFSGLMRSGVNFLISVGKQRLLLLLILGSILGNALGNVVLVKIGLGIVGIALSTAFWSSCLSLAIWLTVFKTLGLPPGKQIRSALDLFAPALIFALIAVASRALTNVTSATKILPSLLFAGIQIAAYCGTIFAIPRYRRSVLDAFGYLVRIARERLLTGGRPPGSGGSGAAIGQGSETI
jgi:O-antigen/teichoic acid export membrane protein